MKKTGEVLGFHCEVELAALIESRARDEGKTVSEYIREVLIRGLEDESPAEGQHS
jgi:hypothetical protein